MRDKAQYQGNEKSWNDGRGRMKIDFDEKIVLKKLIYHVTSCKMLPRQTADAALILAMLPAKNGRLLSHLSFPK